MKKHLLILAASFILNFVSVSPADAQNSAPQFSLFSNEYSVIAGEKLIVSFNLIDSNKSDSLVFTAQSDLGDYELFSSPNVTQTPYYRVQSGRVDLKPELGDTLQNPYKVYLTVSDGKVSTQDTLFIEVLGRPERINYNKSLSNCGYFEFDFKTNFYTQKSSFNIIEINSNQVVMMTNSNKGELQLEAGTYVTHHQLKANQKKGIVLRDTFFVTNFLKLTPNTTYDSLSAAYTLSSNAQSNGSLKYDWFKEVKGQTEELGLHTPNINVQVWEDAVFKVLVESSNGCRDSAEFEIITTSNIHLEASLEMRVYPNPSNGMFYLEAEAPDGKITNYRVLDTYGKVVLERKVNATNISESIGMTGFSAGVYTLQVNSQNGLRSIRIVIQ